MPTTLLDDSILRRYEEALRRVGAGIVEHWRPGLADAEIASLEQTHDIVLPEEARRVWRWHDGCDPRAKPLAGIAPGRLFLPLAHVLEGYSASVGATRQLYKMDRVISPFTAPPHIHFDCRGESLAPVPILVDHDFEEPKQTLPSIAALFTTWTRFIETGLWRIQADGHWDFDYIDRLTDDIIGLGVY
ncbi:MAG TPA: hypothetical protein PKB03_08145 [Baekduia sp.]|nr:hypothetical protein [Baekduia sp.]